MTLPRSSYGGGYYAAPAYPDTPIYDLLVSERGTPQIAPIRVPAEYAPGNNLPALPSGQGNSQQQSYAPQGYPSSHAQPALPPPGAQQPSPLHQAPAQYAQQPQAPQRGGYPAQWPQPQQAQQQAQQGQGQYQQQGQAPQAQRPQQYQQPYQQAQQQPPQMQPVRPSVPRQMPSPYEDPYGGHQYPGRGY